MRSIELGGAMEQARRDLPVFYGSGAEARASGILVEGEPKTSRRRSTKMS